MIKPLCEGSLNQWFHIFLFWDVTTLILPAAWNAGKSTGLVQTKPTSILPLPPVVWPQESTQFFWLQVPHEKNSDCKTVFSKWWLLVLWYVSKTEEQQNLIFFTQFCTGASEVSKTWYSTSHTQWTAFCSCKWGCWHPPGELRITGTDAHTGLWTVWHRRFV